MKPPEETIPDPSDARLAQVVTLFNEGDYRTAKRALGDVERAALSADDQPIHDRMRVALSMEPLFVYGLIGALALWFYLFWTNTG